MTHFSCFEFNNPNEFIKINVCEFKHYTNQQNIITLKKISLKMYFLSFSMSQRRYQQLEWMTSTPRQTNIRLCSNRLIVVVLHEQDMDYWPFRRRASQREC